MNDALAPLLADGIIDEVLGRLKTGKEAEIFLVRALGRVLAAKVYKDRKMRSFQNDAAYKEGRSVRSSRTQRAMDKGSRFGRAADAEAWKTKEAEALQKLFDAGVRVPTPHMFYEGVLLMEVVVDADGNPAPRLIDASIQRENAAPMYADLRQQIVRILSCDLVHGDLSPYNVLLASTGPTIIDFPQVIGAAHNQQAEHFFRRDLEGVGAFFRALDPDIRSVTNDAHEIWRAYARRELTADFVPSGRIDAPPRNAARHDRGRPEPRRDGRPRAPHPERGGHPHDQGQARHRPPGGTSPGHPRPARPGHKSHPAAVVSYVGQPLHSVAPQQPQEQKPKRRRRRRRRGGGRPPV